MQWDPMAAWCSCCLMVCSVGLVCFPTREAAVELGTLGWAVGTRADETWHCLGALSFTDVFYWANCKLKH